MLPEKNAIPATNLESKVPVSVPSHEVITHIPEEVDIHTYSIEKVITTDDKDQLMDSINEASDNAITNDKFINFLSFSVA